MSIQPHQPNEIPEETQRVAHLAFPKGNLYMRMREELGCTGYFLDPQHSFCALPSAESF